MMTANDNNNYSLSETQSGTTAVGTHWRFVSQTNVFTGSPSVNLNPGLQVAIH